MTVPHPNLLQSDVLTAGQLALILRVHPATLRREAAADRVPHQRLGRRYLFSVSRVLAWLQEGYRPDPAVTQSEPVAIAGDDPGGASPPNEDCGEPHLGSVCERTAAHVLSITQGAHR